MTLLIAQKKGGEITFSSDSRISFGSNGYIDFGIKIFSVPVKIESPTQSETGISTVDYEHKLGFAFAGNAINSYTVKESIFEILQNLQHLPGYTDFSMDGITKLILKVYKKINSDLLPIIQNTGCCILLGGYCPVQNKVRVFKFYTEIIYSIFEERCEEILQNDGIEFIGTGKKEAIQIHSQNNDLPPLHIIRKVINDKTEPTVGGGLQYGEFKKNDFKIYGVANYEVNSDGSFKGHTYGLRGINLYKDDFQREIDEFHIAFQFKTPFQKEIDDLIRKQIEE